MISKCALFKDAKYSWNIKVGVEKLFEVLLNIKVTKMECLNCAVCVKCDWRKLRWPKLKVRQNFLVAFFWANLGAKKCRFEENPFFWVSMMCCWCKGSQNSLRVSMPVLFEQSDRSLKAWKRSRRKCANFRGKFWRKIVDFFFDENADFRGDLQCLKVLFFAENLMGSVVQSLNRCFKDGFNRWLKMVSIDGVKMVLADGFKGVLNLSKAWLVVVLKLKAWKSKVWQLKAWSEDLRGSESVAVRSACYGITSGCEEEVRPSS